MSGNITITGKNCTVYNAPVYRGRRRGGSRKCYNCNDNGHFSRDCVKPTVNGGGGGRGRGSGRGSGRGRGKGDTNGRDRDDGGKSDTRPRSRSRSEAGRRPLAAAIISDTSYDEAARRCTEKREKSTATSTYSYSRSHSSRSLRSRSRSRRSRSRSRRSRSRSRRSRSLSRRSRSRSGSRSSSVEIVMVGDEFGSGAAAANTDQ